MIDKAALLDMKKGVDFAAHLQKIVEINDLFNRGRTGLSTSNENETKTENESACQSFA